MRFVMCDVTGADAEGGSRFVEAIVEDETTTHEQWLDVVHVCQVYGYHDSPVRCARCVDCIGRARCARWIRYGYHDSPVRCANCVDSVECARFQMDQMYSYHDSPLKGARCVDSVQCARYVRLMR